MKPLYSIPYYPSSVNKVGSVLLMTMLSSYVIAEPVYGGKDHQSYIHKSVDNSHKTGINTFADASIISTLNQVQANNYSNSISQNTTIYSDLFGGSAVYHATSGEAKAGNSTSDRSNASTATAFANAQATIEDSFIYANQNAVQVTDNGSVVGNVYGGSAILRVYAAKAEAGDASATGDDSRASAYANSYTVMTNSAVHANENTITITGNTSTTGSIFAGKAALFTLSQEAIAGNVDAEFTESFANSHSSIEDSSAHADRNIITITGNALVKGHVYGGYSKIIVNSLVAKAGNANFINSSNSSANVHASSINNTLSANHNSITITENAKIVAGNLFGGYAALIAVAGQATSGTENGHSGNASAYVHAKDTKLYANNNQIILDGSVGSGSIFGGYLIFSLNSGKTTQSDGKSGDTHIDQSGSVAQAINNSITIGDNARILAPSTSLYGGYLDANEKRLPESYDVFSGNTLNFSAKPISISRLANFEHYNFAIQPELANTQTALITAKDVVFGTDSINNNSINNTSKFRVVGIDSGDMLKSGDTFYLIRAGSTYGFGGEGSITQAQQGISFIYDVETEVDMNQGAVIAKIIDRKNPGSASDIKINPQLEALPAGQQAGVLLLSRGADMIAEDMVNAIQHQDNGVNFFMHNVNNYARYSSGYLKSDDKLFTAVISYKQDKLASALFVETGSSNYDSSISPASNKVNSDGNNRYYGLGMLSRYQFDKGLYVHGSLRVGTNKSTFSSKDIVNLASGESASYTLKSKYVGTHVGVGKVFTLRQGNELDLSAKYLWSYLEGKKAVVAGDPISFNSTDSKRLRTNANLSHQYNQNLKLNLGLGYEHEFDAKAEGSTYGTFDIKARSVQGGTGIISVGATYQSETNANFSVDIKTDGYFGKRNGASLGISLNYKF